MLGDVLGHRDRNRHARGFEGRAGVSFSGVCSLRQQAGRGRRESGASVSFHVAHKPGGQQGVLGLGGDPPELLSGASPKSRLAGPVSR